MSDDDRAADPADRGVPGPPHAPDLPDADRTDPTDATNPTEDAALARTRADLAAHGARTPAMPPGLLADIDRALARERAGEGGDGGERDRNAHHRGDGEPPPGQAPDDGAGGRAPRDLRGDRRWTRRRGRLLVVALAAGAAAVAAAVVASVAAEPDAPAPAPTAAPPSVSVPAPGEPGIPVLADGDGPAALRAGLGRTDYGPLADPDRLAACLAAHGVPAGVRPVGARQVVVDGRAGVLLVLPTGTAARFRLLVVEPGCASGTPLTVSDTLVGR